MTGIRVIRREQIRPASTEDCEIVITTPIPCIGCGEPPNAFLSETPITEALRNLLCNKCRTTLRAFRFLAEQSMEALNRCDHGYHRKLDCPTCRNEQCSHNSIRHLCSFCSHR